MTLPDIPMIEFFGRGGALKPSWYGDCLPEPRLPDAHRPVPAGPARPRPRSCPSASASTTSRRRSTRWSGARCCARSWCSTDGGAVGRWFPSHRAGPHQRHLLDRRRGLRRREQHLARRRRHEVLVIDAAHDAEPIADAVGDRPAGRHRLHPRPQRPHQRGRRRWPTATTARRSCCTPTTACCGTSSTRPGPPTASWPTATSSRSPASVLNVRHTPGHSPGGVCLSTTGRAGDGTTRVRRRHAVQRRPRRHRPVVQRLPHDHRVDPHPPAHARPTTTVHTGHGDDTTIGAEAPHLDEWIARGH